MMRDERDLPWLAEPLAQLRDQSRGHALMLQGGAGSGQFELAWRLAQAWLCESPPGPCGRCPSCHLSLARTHADLKVLMPETVQEAMGWNATDAAGDGDGSAAETGDARSGKRKPSREIKVDAIRSAIAWAHTSTLRGRGKVLILHPAEAMNAVAANALLKTLEEPAAGVRLLLCTREPAYLLPTIRSRCQQFRFMAPGRERAASWLNEKGIPDAEVLLDAAGGEVLDAEAMAAAGFRAIDWNQMPRRILLGDFAALSGLTAPQLLQVLQKLCHDALCVAAQAPPRYFSGQAFSFVNAAAAPVARPVLHDWQRALQQVVRHDEHPWHAGLLHDALVAQAQKALSAICGKPHATHRHHE